MWYGIKGAKGRNDKWVRDDMPGLVIRHCGHPTALRPYWCAYKDMFLTAWDIQPWCWPRVNRAECQNIQICALRSLADWKSYAASWYLANITKEELI